MNNITSIVKSKTKPHHDTMRQISRSETPSRLNEIIKIIAGGCQPVYWSHHCEEYQGKNIRLEAGQLCPVCFVDQDGKSHTLGGAV